MNRNRAQVILATLCIIVAGFITLYNVGVFDTSARRATPQEAHNAEGTEGSSAGVIPKDPF